MTTADLGRVDVLVIGAGNAAANAALQAREMGASVAMLETAPKEARGGNSAFTGGAFRFTFSTVDDLVALAPDIARPRPRQYRFRQLHGRAVLRRHASADRVPLRPRADGRADRRQLRRGAVAQEAGHPLPARARPAGVQGRRQVQVLGRARLPPARRRRAAGQDAARGASSGAGIEVLYDTTGRGSDPRGWPRAGRARAPARRGHRAARQGRGARLRRVRIQSRDARPLSRAQLGPRQGARHPLQQRPGPPHGHRDRRRHARPLVGRACRAMGRECAALRRPHDRRPLPEAQLSLRHHRQRARASASSTRAPTSTATPTPSTGTRF